MKVDRSVLATYLEHVEPLIGDQQAGRTMDGIVEGIVVGGSLQCSRIAAFSPEFEGLPSAYKRVRRLVHGETQRRSELGEAKLSQALQAAGVGQLAGADAVWVALDSNDLRRLLDLLATRALLTDYIGQHGELPPQVAAFLPDGFW